MVKLDMKVLLAALLALAGVATTGMAQDSTRPAPPREPTPQTKATPQTVECPEFVRGAKMSVSNVDGGVRIKVVAGQPGYVASLRQMTREVAGFVEDHERTQGGTQQQQQQSASQGNVFPPVQIDVKNVDGGATATIKPEQKSNLAEVRTQAKNLETLFHSSTCVTGTQSMK